MTPKEKIIDELKKTERDGIDNLITAIENVLKSGKAAAKPYKTNPDLLYVPHEIRSIVEAERWIHLSEDEEFAILYHNGMYSELKYAYSGKETILSLILHFADLWCSRVVEIEDEGKEEKE